MNLPDEGTEMENLLVRKAPKLITFRQKACVPDKFSGQNPIRNTGKSHTPNIGSG